MVSKNIYLLKKTTLIIILTLLLMSVIQWQTPFVNEKKLTGNVLYTNKVEFTLDGWLDGTYQKAYESWYNENFGFAKTAIRLNNQIQYTLFKESEAKDIIVGKNGHLFYKDYILAFTGKDFPGETILSSFIYKLKKVQDTLNQMNISVLTVLAPGPASYFPEDIPESYGGEGEKTIYRFMLSEMKRQNIAFIDFNAWFRAQKGKVKYNLFPLSGTHWSIYGATLATDSLIKYIEKQKNIDLPNLQITNIIERDSFIAPDNDITEVANVFFSLRDKVLGYPVCNITKPPQKKSINMLVVGDSYFDVLFRHCHLIPECIDKIDFWSYNELIYHSDGSPETPTDQVNVKNELLKNNILVLMATEANYSGMFWGFIEETYNQFFDKNAINNQVLKKYENAIRKDKNWFMEVQRKAKESNIPLDSVLRLDAQWLMNEELKKGTNLP